MRNAAPFLPDLKLPFNTVMGLKPDSTTAGYNPASKPTNKSRANKNAMSGPLLLNSKAIEACVNCFNQGNDKAARGTASSNASSVMKNDSPRNCPINWD